MKTVKNTAENRRKEKPKLQVKDWPAPPPGPSSRVVFPESLQGIHGNLLCSFFFVFFFFGIEGSFATDGGRERKGAGAVSACTVVRSCHGSLGKERLFNFSPLVSRVKSFFVPICLIMSLLFVLFSCVVNSGRSAELESNGIYLVNPMPKKELRKEHLILIEIFRRIGQLYVVILLLARAWLSVRLISWLDMTLQETEVMSRENYLVEL